jgi:hypothetical protein
VDIDATLNPTKDRVTILIRDGDHSIQVILKKGSNGFGSLEDVLDMNMAVGSSSFSLVADLTAHVKGEKAKEMDLSALKVNADISLTKCQPKIAPTVCPPCSGAACFNIKKCQAFIQDTKEPSANKTHVVKLDAAWRTCFNRTNTRKSEDFLISLISVQECRSKDRSDCPRSIWDFSNLRITSGNSNGVPTADNPTVVHEGKLPLLGDASGNSVYLKMIVSLNSDILTISFQLNKGDKFQWVPQEKNAAFIFTFKVWGQMAVYILPKSAEKGEVKSLQFEIRDNIKLQTKPGYSSDFVVKTRLNLDFPLKVNGQYIKLEKKEIQQGKATLIDLTFYRYHFVNNVLNYGPITGKLTWKQYTPAEAEADTQANAALQAGSDSFGEDQQDSSACGMSNWVALM